MPAGSFVCAGVSICAHVSRDVSVHSKPFHRVSKRIRVFAVVAPVGVVKVYCPPSLHGRSRLGDTVADILRSLSAADSESDGAISTGDTTGLTLSPARYMILHGALAYGSWLARYSRESDVRCALLALPPCSESLLRAECLSCEMDCIHSCSRSIITVHVSMMLPLDVLLLAQRILCFPPVLQ